MATGKWQKKQLLAASTSHWLLTICRLKCSFLPTGLLFSGNVGKGSRRSTDHWRLTAGNCPVGLPQQAAEKEIHVAVGEFRLLDWTVRPIPLVEPVDHAQQGKRSQARGNRGLASLPMLDLRDEILEHLDVLLFSRVDLSTQRPLQRTILVQNDGDLHVAGAHDQVNVADDRLAQRLTRVCDGLYSVGYVLLQNVHAIVHDLKQQPILATYVVIEARLGETYCQRDVLHRRAVVALLKKHARGDAADVAQLSLVGPHLFLFAKSITEAVVSRQTAVGIKQQRGKKKLQQKELLERGVPSRLFVAKIPVGTERVAAPSGAQDFSPGRQKL